MVASCNVPPNECIVWISAFDTARCYRTCKEVQMIATEGVWQQSVMWPFENYSGHLLMDAYELMIVIVLKK